MPRFTGADQSAHGCGRVADHTSAPPRTNHRALVFVSERVGNVQHHLKWFTLLDQLWVC